MCYYLFLCISSPNIVENVMLYKIRLIFLNIDVLFRAHCQLDCVANFCFIANLQEEDKDVDSDKDSRDKKRRHVLRALQAGTIRYSRHDNLFCPFCVRIIANDRNSMIRHAVGVGNGSETSAPHVKAKHAATTCS